MTHTQTAPSSHPAVSLQIESKLTARQVPFTFEPNLAIETIREVEGNQVRLSEHRAPKAMVARYAAQMKGGAIFPAIVVNGRHELIDGNTRWTAAQAQRQAHDRRVRLRRPVRPAGALAVGRAQPVPRPLDDRGGDPRVRN